MQARLRRWLSLSRANGDAGDVVHGGEHLLHTFRRRRLRQQSGDLTLGDLLGFGVLAVAESDLDARCGPVQPGVEPAAEYVDIEAVDAAAGRAIGVEARPDGPGVDTVARPSARLECTAKFPARRHGAGMLP